MVGRLAVLRHGATEWNLEDRFTGSIDVALASQGHREARVAARLLNAIGFAPLVIHTSALERTRQTAAEMRPLLPDPDGIRVRHTAALDERSYGALEGLVKADVAAIFGSEQTLAWRRSFRQRAPERLQLPDGTLLRGTRPAESLEDVLCRVRRYWCRSILPDLLRGNDTLVVGHSNSLRTLIVHVEGRSMSELRHLDLATGLPRFLDLSPWVPGSPDRPMG